MIIFNELMKSFSKFDFLSNFKKTWTHINTLTIVLNFIVFIFNNFSYTNIRIFQHSLFLYTTLFKLSFEM